MNDSEDEVEMFCRMRNKALVAKTGMAIAQSPLSVCFNPIKTRRRLFSYHAIRKSSIWLEAGFDDPGAIILSFHHLARHLPHAYIEIKIVHIVFNVKRQSNLQVATTKSTDGGTLLISYLDWSFLFTRYRNTWTEICQLGSLTGCLKSNNMGQCLSLLKLSALVNET